MSTVIIGLSTHPWRLLNAKKESRRLLQPHNKKAYFTQNINMKYILIGYNFVNQTQICNAFNVSKQTAILVYNLI